MDYIFTGTVYNVVDGDTIDIELDLGFRIKTRQRLRLSGIDTPERGQPGYDEAKVALSNLILGKTVTCITFKPSKYGYFLAVIEQKDSDVTINQHMINEGLAKPYFGGAK